MPRPACSAPHGVNSIDTPPGRVVCFGQGGGGRRDAARCKWSSSRLSIPLLMRTLQQLHVALRGGPTLRHRHATPRHIARCCRTAALLLAGRRHVSATISCEPTAPQYGTANPAVRSAEHGHCCQLCNFQSGYQRLATLRAGSRKTKLIPCPNMPHKREL